MGLKGGGAAAERGMVRTIKGCRTELKGEREGGQRRSRGDDVPEI